MVIPFTRKVVQNLLETANGLQYDYEAYTSLIGAENLDDVKEFILSKIK